MGFTQLTRDDVVQLQQSARAVGDLERHEGIFVSLDPVDLGRTSGGNDDGSGESGLVAENSLLGAFVQDRRSGGCTIGGGGAVGGSENGHAARLDDYRAHAPHDALVHGRNVIIVGERELGEHERSKMLLERSEVEVRISAQVDSSPEATLTADSRRPTKVHDLCPLAGSRT